MNFLEIILKIIIVVIGLVTFLILLLAILILNHERKRKHIEGIIKNDLHEKNIDSIKENIDKIIDFYKKDYSKQYWISDSEKLSSLVDLCIVSKEYKLALKIHLVVLRFRRKFLGVEDQQYGDIINRLILIHENLNHSLDVNFLRSQCKNNVVIRADQQYENIKFPNAAEDVYFISRKLQFKGAIESYDKAVPSNYVKAIETLYSLCKILIEFDISHRYAIVLVELGRIYSLLELHDLANQHYFRAYDIFYDIISRDLKINLDNLYNRAVNLVNLAECARYLSTFNDPNIEYYYIESKEIFLKIKSKDLKRKKVISNIISLIDINLSSFYLENKTFDKALFCAHSSAIYFETAMAKIHSERFNHEDTLKTEDFIFRYMLLKPTCINEYNPRSFALESYITSAFYFAKSNFFLGNFSEALRNFEIVYSFLCTRLEYESKLNNYFFRYRETCFYIGYIYANFKEYEKSLQYLGQSLEIGSSIIGEFLVISKDNERLEFFKKMISESYMAYLSLVSDIVVSGNSDSFSGSKTDLVINSYNYVLKRKSIITEAKISEAKEYDENKIDLNLENTFKFDEIYKTLKKLEKKVNYPWNDKTLIHEYINQVDYHSIQKILPDSYCIIDYIYVDKYDFNHLPIDSRFRLIPHYFSYLILKDQDPIFSNLGTANNINELIKAFNYSTNDSRVFNLDELNQENDIDIPLKKIDEINNKDIIDNNSSISKQLENHLVSPFRYKLKKNIFISPDFDLSFLSFETLISEEGSVFLDKYNITYLNVARDLISIFKENEYPLQDPFILANPNFELNVDHISNISKDLLSQCEDKFHINYEDSKIKLFSLLPSTQLEGEVISKILDVKLYSNSIAQKKYIENLNSPIILHLATHGYYSSKETSIFENNLSGAGLALAGINSLLKKYEYKSLIPYSFLSTIDVSKLNLMGTKLVVTSACATALGRQQISESVIGLRRSFFLAGAETLIVTLWNVHDISTAILMSYYYYYLVVEKMGRSHSLILAKKQLRSVCISDLREKWLNSEIIDRFRLDNPSIANYLYTLMNMPDDYRPFDNPAYWGAFVCIGNPDPL